MFRCVFRVQYKIMYYVVALGNPGDDYKKTRHNVGFAALDFIVTELDLPQFVSKSKYGGRYSEMTLEGVEVAFLYPDTFMNHSGTAVKKLVPLNQLSQLIVLYDDVALPLGAVRISFDRGDGGHNGLKSIINTLNSKEFLRVRIGVAATSFWTGKIKVVASESLAKFVLGKFTGKEERVLQEQVFPLVLRVIRTIVSSGKEKAMNTYN